MIPALRSAQTPTTRRIEWLRVVMMFLLPMSFAMDPVELFIVGQWLDTWQSLIPFILTVPGLLFTVCRRPSGRPRWRPWFLPAGGHWVSPVVATGLPRPSLV